VSALASTDHWQQSNYGVTGSFAGLYAGAQETVGGQFTGNFGVGIPVYRGAYGDGVSVGYGWSVNGEGQIYGGSASVSTSQEEQSSLSGLYTTQLGSGWAGAYANGMLNAAQGLAGLLGGGGLITTDAHGNLGGPLIGISKGFADAAGTFADAEGMAFYYAIHAYGDLQTSAVATAKAFPTTMPTTQPTSQPTVRPSGGDYSIDESYNRPPSSAGDQSPSTSQPTVQPTFTGQSDWLSQFINQTSGIVGRATLPLRVAGGLAESVIDGDAFDDPNEYMQKNGSFFDPNSPFQVVFINGIETNVASAVNSLDQMLQQIGLPISAGVVVPNDTHYVLGLGDIIQIIGNELGLVDLPMYRAAKQINQIAGADIANGDAGGTPINVFAHSQGTQVFLGATEFMDAVTRSMIAYHGYGGEEQMGDNLGLGYVLNDPGLNGPKGNDPVPGLGQSDLLKYFFNGSSVLPAPQGLIYGAITGFATHFFNDNYLPKIGPNELRH
jgi:hypothetical protein